VLDSGRGAWLRDSHGHEVLDMFSGLWCVNVGYGRQSSVQVAAEQMQKLPYATTYCDFAAEPAMA
jgi:4-aminobutyrate---pyruvate transaminase